MTPDEYVILAGRTDPDRTYQVADKITEMAPNGSWILHASIGISGEAGELSAAIQRWLYYGKELDVTNIKEELGDLVWYIAQACRALQISIDDLMESNINKLKFRYPDRYTDHHAAEENRDREGEREVVQKPLSADMLSIMARMGLKAPEAPRTGQEEMTRLTGKPIKQRTCQHCKTPVSDRAKYCPECQEEA